MKNNFLKWLKAAGIRAVKTVSQAALAAIGTSAMLDEVNWIAVLSTAALSGVLSLLTSIAGLPEVKKTNAVGEEINKGYDGEDGI